MRPLAVVVAVTLLAAAPARAESWAAWLGTFLHTATRVEVIHVGTITRSTISGNLVDAIRSPSRPGAVVQVDLAGLVAPAVGDDVLVVCDDALCPRAAGIDDHGAFVLHARELMNGADVRPNLVERASLRTLAAGQPAADLCFAGTIALLDDHATPPFVARISAAEGSGRGAVDGTKLAARLEALDDAGLALRLGEVQLVAAHPVRGPDGCFGATLRPIRPMPRTRTALTAALAGKAVESKLATGAWTIPTTTRVVTGHHTVELAVDRDGQLVLASDLASGSVAETTRSPGHLALGFSAHQGGYPMFGLEFPVSGAGDLAAAIAASLAATGQLIVEAFWTASDGKATTRTSLGKLTLRYLPETSKGRR